MSVKAKQYFANIELADLLGAQAMLRGQMDGVDLRKMT